MGRLALLRPISSSSRNPLLPTSLCAMAPTGGPTASVTRTLRPLLVRARSSDDLVPSRVVLSPAGGPEQHDFVFLARLGATPWPSSADLAHQNRTTLTTQGMHKSLGRRLNPLDPFSSRLPYGKRKDLSPPRKESRPPLVNLRLLSTVPSKSCPGAPLEWGKASFGGAARDCSPAPQQFLTALLLPPRNRPRRGQHCSDRRSW
jgi:hypothetical protein